MPGLAALELAHDRVEVEVVRLGEPLVHGIVAVLVLFVLVVAVVVVVMAAAVMMVMIFVVSAVVAVMPVARLDRGLALEDV